MHAFVLRFLDLDLVAACLLPLLTIVPGFMYSIQPLPEVLLEHRPNELGRVPVLMYHTIIPRSESPDPTVEPFMYRTIDEFWGDLLWLYENDFYLIGMNQLVSGNIDIPAGKHPVVITFNDSTSRQFSAVVTESGELSIDPDCAVGIMERFHAKHPDFGRGAHFSLVEEHRFSYPEHEEDELYVAKIQWLTGHNYEIGNQTLSLSDLTNISDDEFAYVVSGPILWADEFMGVDHPMNATRILTLPPGRHPLTESNPGKVKMMEQGFLYKDEWIRLTGVLERGGGSSEIPWSIHWNPLSIPRLPAETVAIDEFRRAHLSGEDPYYTSDGSTDQVTVPWPLPEAQWGELNEEAVQNASKEMVKYHPESGKLFMAKNASRPQLIGIRLEDTRTGSRIGEGEIQRRNP